MVDGLEDYISWIKGVPVLHQENHRALFCPGTICESVAELGHMQDYKAGIASKRQSPLPFNIIIWTNFIESK